METKIIKIGDSKGIIIPSEILRLLNFGDKVSIAIDKGKMVLSAPKPEPREGWENMIRKDIEKNGLSEILIPNEFDEENLDDWTW